MPKKKSTVGIDFILVHVSIRDLLAGYQKLGQFTQRRNLLIGKCPIHDGCGDTEFQADLTCNWWRCTTCGTGDVIDFVKKKERLHLPEAAEFIVNLCQLPRNPSQQ